MQITNVKINGLKNPIGFNFESTYFSWHVTDVQGKFQKNASISISLDEKMQDIIENISGNLDQTHTEIALKLVPKTRYYYQIEVLTDLDEYLISDVYFFETGKMDDSWSAHWITTDKNHKFHPIFKKSFKVTKPIKQARIYMTGLGLYEISIDQHMVTNELLTPHFNNYDDYIQVQTYDVTSFIKNHHSLNVLMGNGWYKGHLGYEGQKEIFGDSFKMILELEIIYQDESKEIIISDETWSYEQSNIIDSDIYNGIIIDDTLTNNTVNYPAKVLEKSKSNLIDRYSLPIIIKEHLEVQELIKTPKGDLVLDFGQNFSGFVSFKSMLKKGQTVTLYHGEVLQDNEFYNENLRAAKAEITYTSNGNHNVIYPKFTFMGFRYVKLEGFNEQDLDIKDFMGQVIYSNMDQIGYLKTGHTKINRLIQNALWGQKSNFIDMPTDCPQRDERLGWTGDAQVFSPTASFFMDTRAFYRKYLFDMRSDQVKYDGSIANYYPNYKKEPGGSSVWGDAATFIPDTLFEVYNNQSDLRLYYQTMKDWVLYIYNKDKHRENGPKYTFDFNFTFGDWVAMDGVTPQSFKGGTEDAYISTVYYYASALKVSKAAHQLNNETDKEFFKDLANHIKEYILNEYFTSTGRLAIDTQTGYTIALYFDIYKNKDKLIDGFKTRLRKDGYRIKSGFVGAPLMCETLANNGMENLAFHLLLQEEFPSWLYTVNLGATTIWERWNSLLPDGKISGTQMNSLNHYAYGSIVNYIHRYIAGIKPLASGYKTVEIKPQINAYLKHMAYTYNSTSGTYKLSWEILSDGQLKFKIHIPFNSTAHVYLPGYTNEKMILNSGVYIYQYKPEKDYRKPFSWHSTLEDLYKNDKAMNIIKNDIPIAYQMLINPDIETLTTSLLELKHMQFLGIKSSDVEKAVSKIIDIIV